MRNRSKKDRGDRIGRWGVGVALRLALRLVVVGLVGAVVVGCEQGVTRVEFDALQKEAVGAKAELQELKARSATEISDLEEQLSEQSGARDSLESEVEVLKQQLEDAQKELEGTKAEYEDYRRKYRVSVRENAKDRVFEKMVVSGEREEVFNAVTVMELNPARVRVRHESGVTTLPLANLSPEIQAELAFDLEEATAFLADESKPAEPEVLTQEEKNQRLRDQFAKQRMENLAKWKETFAESKELEKQMAAVAAKQRAVVAALNRYYTVNRKPSGAQLNNVNSLKRQRAELDRKYEELKIKHRKLLN